MVGETKRRVERDERRSRRDRHSEWLLLLVLAIILAIISLCITVKAVSFAQKQGQERAETESSTISPATEEIAQNALECETEENELIEAALLEKATRLDNVTVTHYCECRKCCGRWSDGLTATGTHAIPGVTVAVDPSVIPLGSDVLVDYGDGEIQYYKADDTGVTGNHIDLLVGNHEEAVELGIMSATVWYVEIT